ncbi:MBL fold metallo-hydrolase [Alkalihalobacillus sp. 1P02AB]|uniref:MBL fold metallo-hydrolase n=1 Tax=Alkalihalobacillus sp. 1P02AB TaxID=3132260 RepID=UPI0039A6BE62
MKKYQIFPIEIKHPSNLKSINFYLVKTERSLLLIDAGFNAPSFVEHFEKNLHQYGFSLNDLTAILLTHHHIDHVGLVNYIAKTNAIPIYVHPEAFPRLKREPRFLQRRIQFFKELYQEMGCGLAGENQVSYLKESLVKNQANAIQADLTRMPDQYEGFEVIDFPGHSPDQVAFYKRDEEVLFGGDLLIEHISSNAIVEPNLDGEKILTLVEHKHSLEKCLQLPLKKVYSGHGSIITNPHDLIRQRITGIDQKANRLLEYIKVGVNTGNALALEMYEHRYSSQFSLVMSEIIGHLDYLENNDQVVKKKQNGVWNYFIQNG